MERLGVLLRNLRMEWGFSLREVKDKTEMLAKRWGSQHYASSFSYLAKLERGENDIRVSTLIALSYIYSKRPETFLAACLPDDYFAPHVGAIGVPNATAPLTEGRLFDGVDEPESLLQQPENVPETTSLLPESGLIGNRYRRAIIGRKDRALYPVLRPGAIITVDTHQRAIATPDEWSDEFDRPIYLFYTRTGYICGWGQITGTGSVMNVVSHVMSKLDVLPLVIGREIEVVGRVIGVTMCLEVPSPGRRKAQSSRTGTGN